MNRAALGRAGERKAARHLRRHGLSIIERNWRCRAGELDILARDGDVLVIVEVRTASATSDFAGSPEQTVGPDKRQRLARLTSLWLRDSRWQPSGVRFDVIGLNRRGMFRWDLRWFRDAFQT